MTQEEALKELNGVPECFSHKKMRDALNMAFTALRNERKAKWVMDTEPDDGDCRCSACCVCIDALHKRNHESLKVLGYTLSSFYKFCPNCGAKMEVDE